MNKNDKETLCIVILLALFFTIFTYGVYAGTKNVLKWRVNVEKIRYTGLDWYTNMYIYSTKGKCKIFGGPEVAVKRWGIEEGKTYIIYYAYYRGYADVIIGVQEIG